MKTCILSIISLVVCVTSSLAATALIDFGRSTNTTIGSPTYNDIGALTGGTLLDTTGSATGWSIVMATAGNGTSAGQAGSGADVTSVPVEVSTFAATATRDNFFFNASGSPTNTAQGTITLSGLDVNSTYDLLFYGSRNNAQNNFQTWAVVTGTGGNSATTFSHNSLNNATTVANWTGIQPDSSGIIKFTITGTTNFAGALAINFGQITSTPVPEPSGAFTLLASIGVCLMSSRRRKQPAAKKKRPVTFAAQREWASLRSNTSQFRKS